MTRENSFARAIRRFHVHLPRDRKLGLLFVALFILIVYVSLPQNDIQFVKNYLLWIYHDPFRFKKILIIFIGFIILFCLLQMKNIILNAKRYIRNSSGYFTLQSDNGFHHRHIARKYLRRKLLPGEEVHHIDGKKTANHPSNLCVLMRDDHRAFHRWLSAEYRKLGRKYPPIPEQKRMLREKFHGILL